MTVRSISKFVRLLALSAFLALPAVGGERIYVVKKSDTLSAIARRNKISTQSLAEWNHLKDANVLQAGSKLYIPDDSAKTTKYTVRKGDSLSAIAQEYGLSAGRLVRLNHLPNADQIYPGQTLLLPIEHEPSSISTRMLKLIDKPKIRRGRWKYIVIHHSSSTKDSPAIMDAWHRRRGMENGLAYHFVIGGGGLRMKDGEFYIGDRWKKQLQGGHVHSAKLNDESIGICLVGNFNDKPPTRKQMQVLTDLIEHLMDICNLTPDDVYTHRQINPTPTECPGRKFPLKDLMARLRH